MTAFMIFRITFKEKKFKDAFIKKYKPVILVKDNTQSYGSAWKYLWKANTLICFMGELGYEDPKEIKKNLKEKIKYFNWIPINDLSSWSKK